MTTYQVNIINSEKQFNVNQDETVLDAALRQGIMLAYGCKNGGCGTCKSKVHSGDYNTSDNLLNSGERSQGLALLCCTKAESDLTIEAKVLEGIGDINIKKLPCRISDMQKASDDIIIVKLQLPTNEQFAFMSGQYIDLLLKNNQRRSYSIASNPLENSVELHIRHMSGGLFTDALFGVSETQPALKVRDILRFEGPLGTFFLRESNKPIILLASGTGFAPIKSIINHMQASKNNRPVTLYWGGRRPKDIYAMQDCNEWLANMPNFKFIPVISDALAEDNWQGRTGFLHHAVMQDIPNMQDYEVYACGAPIMVESAKVIYLKIAFLLMHFYLKQMLAQIN
jgi:CDP-4-dehydro-6-deoxyglucose reductase